MAVDRILVIKHSAFGDFVQALGCLRAIRAYHAGAHITLMTTKPFEALALLSGYVDGVYIDARPKWHSPLRWLSLRAWLNGQGFSRVYDLQNSERTCFYHALFKRKPEWSGIARGASHAVCDNAERKAKHVFRALADQLQAAGINGVSYDTLSWIRADVSGFELPGTSAWGRYALLVPGCSAKHAKKRWPAARYAALCEWLHTKGITPVLLGTQDERAVTASIHAGCPYAIDLTGRTSLAQIAVLARGAACAVGNDTGPIHMIAPTGCPTVALYPGFSNPKRHGPLGARVVTIQEQEMDGITCQAVYDALEGLLSA